MFLRALNISGSGLSAQRYRLDIIAQNITNIETTRTESGGPYKRKGVIFEALSDKSTFADKLGQSMAKKNDAYVKPDLVSSYERNNTAYQGSGDYLANKYKSTGAAAASPNITGVRIAKVTEDPTPGKTIYDPEHPDADADGYVELPNVEVAREMVDMMSASRSYESNVQVINAIKAMATKALEIGR
jgi:flagellar basal-body rod protein FlgC